MPIDLALSHLNQQSGVSKACQACQTAKPLDIAFDYAFQPIVNLTDRSIFAHEALVRGLNGESAYSVLSQVNDQNRYQFDQACRVMAVKRAAELQMQELLSINFLPNAVYQPAACIRSTLEACKTYGFLPQQIIFEVTEGEEVDDRAHLVNIFRSYSQFGFHTAIDDFGAGYAGLNLLSEYQPDILKIDMELVRDIDSKPAKQAIVQGLLLTCRLLGAKIVAEGVETRAERDYLAGLGITLMQGYFFCKPAFRALGQMPESAWE